jgi:hypothetical protein
MGPSELPDVSDEECEYSADPNSPVANKRTKKMNIWQNKDIVTSVLKGSGNGV